MRAYNKTNVAPESSMAASMAAVWRQKTGGTTLQFYNVMTTPGRQRDKALALYQTSMVVNGGVVEKFFERVRPKI